MRILPSGAARHSFVHELSRVASVRAANEHRHPDVVHRADTKAPIARLQFLNAPLQEPLLGFLVGKPERAAIGGERVAFSSKALV